MKRASPAVVLLLIGLTAAILALSAPRPRAGDDEEPDYPHGDFVDDCTLCHGDEGRTPAVISPEFNHAKHGFPLTGSHASTDCRACHPSLEFAQADPSCVSCHLDVHRGELGTDCGRCHTPRSFIDRSGMVRAHLSTRFPLRGAHRVAECEACHPLAAQGSLQYVNTPVDCQACHLDSYLATVNPDHQASGFPQSCAGCHGTQTWVPAGFNHDFLGAGIVCASCHLPDYQATANPDHQAAGFPQDCELCHSTRRWAPASFDGLNHDGQFFPIFSGKHRGKWTTCSDCHVVPNNFTQFSCIDCHEHDDREDLEDEHSNVSGFQYDSQACFGCHPRGNS
jgi:hypothetical protein